MSKKQHVRTLKRKKLPYGRYHYVVQIKRSNYRPRKSRTNGAVVEEMRAMLNTTCVGGFRLDWVLNGRRKRVYTELYLVNPMDVAMVKLIHSDKLGKFYKIEVVIEQPDE